MVLANPKNKQIRHKAHTNHTPMHMHPCSHMGGMHVG